MTGFTIEAHPIDQVWGGMRIYDGSKADEIYAALHQYVPGNSDEQKSAIILTDVTALAWAKIFIIFYFYDGPDPPTSGPMSQFLDIDAILDTAGTKSYSKLVCSTPLWPAACADAATSSRKMDKERNFSIPGSPSE